jgi:hypothetical protein
MPDAAGFILERGLDGLLAENREQDLARLYG